MGEGTKMGQYALKSYTSDANFVFVNEAGDTCLCPVN